MTKQVMKEVRVVCNGCHTQRKKLVWLSEDFTFTEPCECGGFLAEESQALTPVEGVLGDDIPGGLVMEHLYPGRKVYSHTEHKEVIKQFNKENGTEYRLSDYGWVGIRDQHLKQESGLTVDLRTQEERILEMAQFLGMSVETYRQTFRT